MPPASRSTSATARAAADTGQAEPGPVHLRRLARTARNMAEMIDATAWASDLDFPTVEKLAAFFEAWEAAPGQAIFAQGDRDPYLCLLASGAVRIVKDTTADEQKTLAAIQPGKTFGEMSLLDGEPRSAGAVAEDRSALLVLTRQRMSALEQQDPRLALVLLSKLAKLMSQRLRLTSGILVEYLDG